MAFWDNNLALSITWGFTPCLGPAAGHRLGPQWGANESSRETEVITEQGVLATAKSPCL